MNKGIRSIIAYFLILSISLSLGTLSAFAANSNGFEFEVANGEVTITGYTGSVSSLDIPSSINEHPVTRIADEAFKGCTQIKSVSLPKTIKSIGKDCFLKTAFYEDKTNWENQLLYINDVLIEADYKLVGPCDIKEGTRVIADYAFMLTNSVTVITIPSSVQYVGEAAFINCDKLTEINVNSENKDFSSANGVLFNKEKSKLIAYPNDNNRTIYTIPDSVNRIEDMAFKYSLNLSKVNMSNKINYIGKEAFAYCKSLSDIRLSDSVSVLPEGIFDHCSSLKYVILPSNITKISNNAFEWCSSLITLNLTQNLSTIGQYAFYNCRGLEEIALPKTVTSIEHSAFYNCKSLKNINYTGNTDEWNSISIAEHNSILDNVKINFNTSVNGSTGTIPEFPEVPQITEPTTLPEEVVPDSTAPVEELPDTKWMSLELYNKDTYSSSGDNFVVEGAIYDIYYAPVENTKCASVVTSNGSIEALAMSLDSDLPFDFCIGSKYYIKQSVSPYGYIADSLWYELQVTEKGYKLLDCSDNKKISDSKYNNTIKMFVTPITGEVALIADYDDSTPQISERIADYVVKEADSDRTLYFDNYYRFNGFQTNYGSMKFTLYSDSFISLSNIPVGEYYFEKIISETNDAVNSERIYFEIKPNESGVDCDLVKIAVKLEYKPSQPYPVGDVNRDGKFNIKDATAVQKYLAHMVESEDINMENADFNGDGKINVKDATTIQKSLAGLLGSVSGVTGGVSQGSGFTSLIGANAT